MRSDREEGKISKGLLKERKYEKERERGGKRKGKYRERRKQMMRRRKIKN